MDINFFMFTSTKGYSLYTFEKINNRFFHYYPIIKFSLTKNKKIFAPCVFA